MSRQGREIALAGLIAFALTAGVQASVTLQVESAIAPTKGSSQSWTAWRDDCLKHLAQTTAGKRSATPLPTAYRPLDTAHRGQIVVSGFPSWEGFAEPAGAYAGEFGSRLHFPLRVLGNGARIRLADLRGSVTTSDPRNALALQADFTNATYNEYRQGLDYGPDRQRGTADDVVLSNGEPAATEADEIIYTGLGIGLEVTGKSIGQTNQDKLDTALTDWVKTDADIAAQVTYTLSTSAGQLLAKAERTVKLTKPLVARPSYLQAPTPRVTGNASPKPPVAARPTPTNASAKSESPLPMFIGLIAGLAVVGLYLGAKWVIRRRRYAALVAPRNDSQR